MSQSKLEQPTTVKSCRWECSRCLTKVISLKDYSAHLLSTNHRSVMRSLSQKFREEIERIRIFQRRAQRQLDRNAEGTPGVRQRYCELCKLNYRDLRSKHETSKAHYDMKRFLMRTCRVCHITFKTPMGYEGHICSVQHLKRKAYIEKRRNNHSEGKKQDDSLENEWFRYYEDDEESIKEGSDKENSSDENVNVGDEYVKKMEIYYCELCRTYCPKKDELEVALKKHCGTTLHLLKYRRYKEDVALKREAERIYKKSKEAKENELSNKDADQEIEKESSEAKLNENDNETDNIVEKENAENVDENKAEELLLFAEFDKELGGSTDEDDDAASKIVPISKENDEQDSTLKLSPEEPEKENTIAENVIQQEETSQKAEEKDDN